MSAQKLYLGVDTSNYTTSLALCANGKIIRHVRRLLPVADGACGLRQSDAVFLHTRALPELAEELFCDDTYAVSNLAGVGVPVAPRDAVGSLDIPTPKGKGDVHLISLSNAKAEDLAQVINTLVERQRAAGTEDQKPDTVLSKDIKVVADKSTNSLVVTARPDEFEALSNIVAKLDVVRKQVFIEALIMEVSSEASFSFGINWAIGGNTGDAAIVGGVSLNGGAVSLSSSGANKTVSLPAGVSIGAILKDAITVGNTSYNIQSILNAVRGNSDVDVLATPQLLTLDNEEASVEVVDNIPFTKESTTRNDNDFTTQSMDYKDVGVKLKITPRISDDGSLRLEVEQEVSRVTQGLITLTNGDQLVAPTTRKRLVKTTILLQDSQTAVIGGLLDDQKTYNQSEVPGLGSIPVLGRTDPVKCWKTAGHGSQTLTQAMQHSCNVALVQIGQLVGARTFYKYAEAFGFLNLTNNVDSSLTAKTGIDLSGESGSIWWSQNTFYDPENFSQLAAASFGQTFTITPLQLITAVSACVNGGYLMKPYVVKSIVNGDGEAVVSNSPTVVRQVVSEQTSATVRQILEQVVGDPVDGTGKNAYVAGYRIGGKTGTSEKVAQDAAGGAKEYIVSFIGFAPADDPQIVILVLLDTPSSSTGIYISGGQMAAPTVGKMMADILPYLGVEPSYSETEKTYMDKTVPNVTGLSVEQAKAALEEVGLQARVYGEGNTVTAQLPGSGAVVASGSTILLYAGKEPSADKETMPDLTNLSYQTARDRMAALGLYIKTNSSITDTAQIVSGQTVAAGTQLDHGTVVEVTLVTSDSSMLGRY